MTENEVIYETSIETVPRGINFPDSLGRIGDGYPEKEYYVFLKEINKIQSQKLKIDEKWERKFNLIHSFIDKNKCHPYWSYKFVGLKSTLKTESRSKYRKEKLTTLFNCNHVKSDGSICSKLLPSLYSIKPDPFKCTQHAKRCPNCKDWIDSHGSNKKYDDYCARCFKRLFPDDPRSLLIFEKSKEIYVRNAISKKALENDLFRDFIHDKPLYTGGCDCTHRRRIDHRKLIGNTILAVETDEYAHKAYDDEDEKLRYDDLYMIHSAKWIFIRFNPDDTKKVKIETLIEEIEKQIKRIQNEENDELLEIIKLFY
jgi:hypothetical protein